jgi:hypothetical protein
LAIPAGNLKAIGTPAQIGAQGRHLVFVSESWSFARMSHEQQSILAHDAIGRLDCGQIPFSASSVPQDGSATPRICNGFHGESSCGSNGMR